MRGAVLPLRMTPERRRTIRGAGPLVFPLAEIARQARALSGLGECPAFAPYPTASGGCSNIAPGLDAHSYFQSGGALSSEGTVGPASPAAGAPALECPAGTKINPVTGRTECVNPVAAKYTTSSGYVLRTSPDENVMREIAAAAEAEARARGINATCGVTFLGGDLLNNNRPNYSADCIVNGQQHSASEMLTGAGFENLIISAGYNRGEPVYQAPLFQPSASYKYLPAGSEAAAVRTTQAAPPASTTTTATAVTAPRTDAVRTDGAPPVTEKLLADVAAIAGQAKTAAAGLPTWALLAGAAGAGYLLLRGKR